MLYSLRKIPPFPLTNAAEPDIIRLFHLESYAEDSEWLCHNEDQTSLAEV